MQMMVERSPTCSSQWRQVPHSPLISVRLFSQWAAGENATERFQKRLICKEKVVQILQTNKEEQNRSVYHGQTPSI
jgi:hypothetical protein